MFKNKHLAFLVIGLIVIGSAIFFYRWQIIQIPLLPTETKETWIIDANLRFQAGSGPIKADLYIPSQPPNYSILSETLVERNYGVNVQNVGSNRLSTWSIRRTSGMQSLYYRVVVYPSNVIEYPLTATPVPRAEFSDAEQAAVDAIIKQVRTRSADINTFATETIKILNDQNNYNAAIILNNNYDPDNIAAKTIAILSQANIISTLVKGVVLTPQTNATVHTGVIVYNEQTWTVFDPRDGKPDLPPNVLIWQYGEAPIVAVSGGTQSQLSINITKNPIPALTLAEQRARELQSNLFKFSLFGLPVKTQHVYQILLTIPIGALIILLLRNFVGIRTFGTFMPVLIALAFRETQLILGLVLFTCIVSAGLLARFYLDQLRLLLVPRLTAILTIVILLMLCISIVSELLGLAQGLSIALFPIVIITMTIERMSIVWDERGAKEAIQSGIGSLFAATVAYSVMRLNTVEYIFFAFPELLLILLAIVLTLGQYHGYRLLELRRFKDLTKQKT